MSHLPPKNRSKWWEYALCRGLDGNIWFPDKPQGRDYFAIARSYCNECPVKQECLDEALLQNPDNDRFGMFGGKSPRERVNIRLGIDKKDKVYGTKVAYFNSPPTDSQRYTKALNARNPIDKGIEALKRKQNDLSKTTIPKQTQLLLNATKTMQASQLTAQASAAMIMAGWEDPMDVRTAAAMFMGSSYVGHIAREGTEAGVLTAQENAAIQGVVELAMQVWKHHVMNGKMNEFAKSED
jgi:hypothetical protein